MSEAVIERIKTVLAGRSDLDIGNFQWVNLDMVKDEAGEQWIAVRSKIYNAASLFLEKRIDDKDVLIRCRGGFILFFSDLVGDAAEARTKELTDALNHFFLGDRVLRNLEIKAETQTLSKNEIAEFVAKTVQQGKVETQDEAKKRGAVSMSGWRNLEKRGKGETAPAASPARSGAGGSPGTQSGGRKEATVHDLHGGHQPHDPFIDPTEELETLSSLPFNVPKAEWEDIIFKPCWDSLHGYITANFCLPRRWHNGRYIYGRSVLMGNDDEQVLETMDHAVAVAAQRGFLNMHANGQKCAVVIPVNYQTVISVQDRIRYFSILQCVPPPMRKYFYIRVDSIPDGAPIGQMEELFRSMKLFGSNLLAKIPAGTIDFGRFTNCPIAIYSTSIEMRWNDRGLPDGIVQKLVQQSISIRRTSRRAALTQVDSADILRFGIDAGYEIFTGDVVGKDQSRPMPLMALTLQSLLQQAG